MSLNGNGVVNIGSKLVHVVVEWSQMVLLSYFSGTGTKMVGWILSTYFCLICGISLIQPFYFNFEFSLKSRADKIWHFLTVDLSWKNLFCYREFFAGQYPKRSNPFPKIQEIFKYFYFFFKTCTLQIYLKYLWIHFGWLLKIEVFFWIYCSKNLKTFYWMSTNYICFAKKKCNDTAHARPQQHVQLFTENML